MAKKAAKFKPWDDDHKLQSATIPNGSATGIEGTHTYEYDAMGRRVSKIVDDVANNTTTKTVFINQLVSLPPLGTQGGRVIAEYQSVNAGPYLLTRSQTFTTAVDELVAVIHQDVAGDPVYYTHHDRRYTIVGSTPETQSTDAAFAHYNVHGRLTQQSTTNPSLPTVPETTPLAYTGRDYDKETNLWHFRARVFSAGAGRFLLRDNGAPYIDGPNLYASYFAPVSTDPSGNKKGDKTCGLPKAFWNWYHRQVKQAGDPDLSCEAARILFDEWVDSGRPGPDNKNKNRKRGNGKRGGGRSGQVHTGLINTLMLCGCELAVANQYNDCVKRAARNLETCLDGASSMDPSIASEQISLCTRIHALDLTECGAVYVASGLGCLIPFEFMSPP